MNWIMVTPPILAFYAKFILFPERESTLFFPYIFITMIFTITIFLISMLINILIKHNIIQLGHDKYYYIKHKLIYVKESSSEIRPLHVHVLGVTTEAHPGL